MVNLITNTYNYLTSPYLTSNTGANDKTYISRTVQVNNKPTNVKLVNLRAPNLIPTKNSLLGLFYIANVTSYTRANAGQQSILPLILALFFLIAISNTLSNVPFGYAPASSLSFSLGISLSVFVAVTAGALTLLGLSWFGHFALDSPGFLTPILALIETISYLARAISLGVRLFANLVAGHALLNIISKMSKTSLFSHWYLVPFVIIPAIILAVILTLELSVAQIQAYVLTVLTTIYDYESKEKHDPSSSH